MLEILEDYVDVFFNREKWGFKVILFSSNGPSQYKLLNQADVMMPTTRYMPPWRASCVEMPFSIEVHDVASFWMQQVFFM